jgi:hypothetical protein
MNASAPAIRLLRFQLADRRSERGSLLQRMIVCHPGRMG